MTFDLFWQAYPRKMGKLAAQKAWAKAAKLADPKEIIAGIEPYKAHKPDWQDYCHPATWLNQGRWMDEYEQPAEPLPREQAKGGTVYVQGKGFVPINEYLN